MFNSSETLGLAEWIIDDSYLSFFFPQMSESEILGGTHAGDDDRTGLMTWEFNIKCVDKSSQFQPEARPYLCSIIHEQRGS